MADRERLTKADRAHLEATRKARNLELSLVECSCSHDPCPARPYHHGRRWRGEAQYLEPNGWHWKCVRIAQHEAEDFASPVARWVALGYLTPDCRLTAECPGHLIAYLEEDVALLLNRPIEKLKTADNT